MYLMAETDETVGAMLYCIATTMRQIDWIYVPCVDGVPAEEDAEAKRFAEIFTSMMSDMNRPFGEHVEDMLTMLWAGFAPVELITKRRTSLDSRYTDGLYGIRALNLIDQTSIWDWVYEADELVGFKQMGPKVIGNGLVPMSKVLNYRTSSQYNRPWGKALLKPAWRAWRLKRKIQDSEALGIERELCGLPIFEMPESVIAEQFETEADGTTPTENAKRAQAMVQNAQSATRDMRLNKSGGLVIPSDTYGDEFESGSTVRKYNFRIQTTGGQRSVDSRTAARDYDHAIARVAMMQFLTLGQRSGGSYSLSDDQSSMAVNSIMALAKILADQWNEKSVPLLANVNAMPAKYRPKLKHSEVNKNGIVQLGQFLSGIAKAEALWGADIKAREGLLKAGNIPYDHDAQVRAAKTFEKTSEMNSEPPPTPVVAPAAGARPRPKPKSTDTEKSEDSPHEDH